MGGVGYWPRCGAAKRVCVGVLMAMTAGVGLLGFPVATAQSLSPIGADPVDLLHANLTFGQPATGSLKMQPGNAEWFASWQGVPNDATPTVSEFEFSGRQARLIYFESVLLGGPNVEIKENPVTSDPLPVTLRLELEQIPQQTQVVVENFSVSVSEAGGDRELVLRAAPSDGAGLETGDSWTLASLAPGKSLSNHNRTLNAVGAPQPVVSGWNVLLEGRKGAVHTDQPRSVHFYGYNVTIRHAGGTETYRTGAFNATETFPGGPRLVPKEAFLVILPQDSHFQLASRDASIRVVSPRLSVAGSFLFKEAIGFLSAAPRQQVLDNHDLHPEGVFVVRSVPPPIGASHRLELDGWAHGVVWPSVPLAGMAARGEVPLPFVVTALAAAALGLLMVKFLAGFFTRLKKDKLLESDLRQRIVDALTANPGLRMKPLAVLVGVSTGSIRHHLTVLIDHQIVRAFKLEGEWRYALATCDLGSVRRTVVMEKHPEFLTLLRHVRPHGTPADFLVAQLRLELGFSTSGSYKVIERAAREGFIVKESCGRSVFVRPAQGLSPEESASVRRLACT